MFNDHDHMVPIIEEFVKNNHNVRLVTLLFDVNNDYILEYLKDKYQIKVEILPYNNDIKTKLIINAHKILTKIYFKRLFFERVKGKLVTVINKSLSNQGKKNSKLAIDRISISLPDVAVVDRTNLENKLYRNVLTFIRSKGIPIVRMTHGIPTFFLKKEDVKSGVNSVKLKYFAPDYDIWTGKNEKSIYDNNDGLISSYNPVLGCSRFSRRWLKKYNELLSYCEIKNEICIDENRIRVLIIMESEYKIDTSRSIELIKKILRIDGVDVYIKPHTRDKVGSVKKLINLQLKYKNFHINRENTVYLMNQCQIVLYFSSSVAIHGLLESYNMIGLPYLCKYNTIFSKYGLGCMCVSDKDVLNLINRYKFDQVLSCDKDLNLDNFFNDTVGSDSIDSIQENYNFILRISQNKIMNY